METNPRKVTVSNEQARMMTHMLAELIENRLGEGEMPNQILALLHGGFYVADLLRRRWGIQMASTVCQHYDDETNQKLLEADVFVSRDLLMSSAKGGKRWLIVDDLTDSGVTMQTTLEWLQGAHAEKVGTIQTATLFHKTSSPIEPDHVLFEIEADGYGNYPWIEFEWEQELVKPTSEQVAALSNHFGDRFTLQPTD